jgi:hypothetical protein
VQRKRHAVPHLPRLRDRRENLGSVGLYRQGLILAMLVEKLCRLFERALAGVDQCQHRGEGGIGALAAVGGGCEIEQQRIARMHDSDLFLSAGFVCREFHWMDPLFSDEIYDQKKYR